MMRAVLWRSGHRHIINNIWLRHVTLLSLISDGGAAKPYGAVSAEMIWQLGGSMIFMIFIDY